MVEQNLYHILALSRIPQLGNIRLKKLLKRWPDARDIFRASQRDLAKQVGDGLARKIKQFDDFSVVDNELDFIEKNDIEILTIFDDNYPHLLKYTEDSPVFLFKKGNFDFGAGRYLSVVGTRKITSYGRQFIAGFVRDIKVYNPVIVSGLAYGVDIAAHRAALDNVLPTVAVMGTPLDTVYPASHRRYFEQILENGAVLTEFWTSDKMNKNNFLQRNRIIAGISQGTLVVESGEQGGALVTAQMAFAYNREVFALPGRVTDTYSRGTNHLIKSEIARLILSADDVAYYLQWEKEPAAEKPEPVQRKLFVELSPEEQKIVDFLAQNGKRHIDDIAVETGMTVSLVASQMMMLELNGIIRQLPGKYFELI